MKLHLKRLFWGAVIGGLLFLAGWLWIAVKGL